MEPYKLDREPLELRRMEWAYSGFASPDMAWPELHSAFAASSEQLPEEEVAWPEEF